MITKERVYGPLCIVICILLLAAGLWPLDFSPKNQVTWINGEQGLHFRGQGLISGHTVGGYVQSAGHLGRSLPGDPDKPGISIEIWLRAAEENNGGVPNFLSFADDSGKAALLLGQWRSSLIIRWPLPGYDFREKWGEIGAKDALTKDVRKLITVAADDKGTAIYLDGRLARSFPGLNLNDLAHGIMDRAFVLGNSPSGNSSWSGDVFGLAFYTGTMNEEEARESFRQWVGGEKKGHARDKRLRGLYLFDEGEGKQVQNSVEGAGPLMIPEHLKFQREILSRPVINDHNKRAYIEDAVINILGFVPLGFFLTAWLKKAGRWDPTHAFLLVTAAGFLISLAIEITQVFIPCRDSSLMDLLCNTIGTGLGVMGAGKLKARKLEAQS